MRTDKPPFNDVRVRRAISHGVNRQAIIDAVFIKGEPTPAISRGVPEWSPRIDQLGPGARYYRHDPKESRRLLAEAGFPNGLKTQLNCTPGYGNDFVDAFQLVQRQLKDSGIDATMNLQEYGAYMSTTFNGKYEGLAVGPFSITWEPHSNLYGMYMPEQGRNSSHVSDPTIISMMKEQMRNPGHRSAAEAHFRHPALRRRAAVLRVSLLPRAHRILAAVREELRAELELRLR
jgi:peptide/nickel transport system substrate-binding protein